MRAALKDLFYWFMRPVIRRRCRGTAISITFDDGPHPDGTARVLELLAQYRIPAVFFLIGQEMEKHPELVQAIIQQGHEVGFHSYDHTPLNEMTPAQVWRDIVWLKRWEKANKVSVRWFRPPYGIFSITGLALYFLGGYRILMWSLDSRDSFVEAAALQENVSPEKVMAGDILLFHDDTEQTIGNLDAIFEKLTRAGYRFGLP